MTAILAAVLLAFAHGCDEDSSRSPDDEDGSASKVPTLRVGHVGHDHHLALYVAALEPERCKRRFGVHLETVKDRQVYDLVDDGRKIARLHLLKVGGGSGMPAAMERGEIDLGLGGTAAVVKFADKGQPIRIIAPLQTDGDMLVMHPDSPITDWRSFVRTAKSARRPLRIGYKAPIAVAKLIFERALAEEAIAYGHEPGPQVDVLLVNFGSETSPLPMMQRGAIDGFVMNQPAVAVAVHKQLGKVIADLRDLPPAGRWHDHPCCCVAATTDLLDRHGREVTAFLKLLAAATRLIHAEPDVAIDVASRWTKYDRAVEADSIPTIAYVCEPSANWRSGMRTWAQLVGEIDLFRGEYKNATPQRIVQDVVDLTRLGQAVDELDKREPARTP
ncbi:MAG: ABC transporter substrate-binding protein [Planctomycetes bacterium]|jgi:NitT/TauT family transport system substrate-binding protein|nr:ABC transporter substrate-binding protein [Planctomycetota bacterium]